MAVLAMPPLTPALMKMAEWRVACDGERLAWQHRSEAGEQRLVGNDPAALAAALHETLEGRAHHGDRLRLALGSHHIRIAALAWPEDRLSTTERQALLYQRWRERLDDVDQCWLGIEDDGAVRLATAVREDLLQRLLDAAAACGVRPRACLPAAALALRHASHAADIRIELDEGSRKTVMNVAGGKLANLSSGWRSVTGPDSSGSAYPGDVVEASSGAIPRASLASNIIRLDGGPRSWLEWF